MHKFGFLVFRRIRIICIISDKNVNCRTNHQFTGYNLDSVYVCSGIKFYSQFLENIIKINFFECPLSLTFVTLTLQKIKKNLVKELPVDKYNIYQSPNLWNLVQDSVNHWQDFHHLHLIQRQSDKAQF